MPVAPKVATFPAIRKALRFYQIASVITGIGLLLLLAEMILRYTPIHLELFAGGSGGVLWFAQSVPTSECQWYSKFLPFIDSCEVISVGDGFNVSQAILVAHGWFYVLYLFACFRVWSLMRWRFPRFLLLALGGVVPLLSFFMEARVAREVHAYLSDRENASAAATAPTLKGTV